MSGINLELNRLDEIGIGITVLTLLGSVALWNRLPSEVAIHFSVSGTAGSYVPKTVAVVAIPLIMIITLGILEKAAQVDPPDDDRVYTVTVITSLLWLAVLQFPVLGWNLGYRVSFRAVLGGSIVLYGILVVYAFWRTGSILNT
jgi:uncharacterized membrane protein